MFEKPDATHNRRQVEQVFAAFVAFIVYDRAGLQAAVRCGVTVRRKAVLDSCKGCLMTLDHHRGVVANMFLVRGAGSVKGLATAAEWIFRRRHVVC